MRVFSSRQSPVLCGENLMEGKFTVYFDDPFWVGVFEKEIEADYFLARVVFGSEPSDAELYQFVLENYRTLQFSCVKKAGGFDEKKKNFKRVQREVRKSMQNEGVGTKAQEAMKLALAQNKQEHRQKSRLEHQQNAEEQFRLRQQRKREKQRGH
jgi:hypothetical protein